MEPKSQARRERDFQERIKKHGGTGLPPEIDFDDVKAVVDATNEGQCLLCSGKWGPLQLHVPTHPEYRHLPPADALLAYRRQSKIPDDVPLSALWYLHRRREGRTKMLADPERNKEYSDKIAQTLSRPRPDLRGRTGRNPSGVVFGSWPMMKLLAKGLTTAQVSVELKATRDAVQKRAEAVGPRGVYNAEFLLDWGKPYTNGKIFEHRNLSGFDAAEYDKVVGFDDGRSNGSRSPSSLANPEDAGQDCNWWHGVARKLTEIAKANLRALHIGPQTFGQDRILKTFVPEMQEINDMLLVGRFGTISRVREAARANTGWTTDELLEWVCEQAQIEKSAAILDMRWQKTLFYFASPAQEAERWIADNLQRLRGTNDGDGQLARELLGSTYGVSEATVQNSMRQDTEAIKTLFVHLLIRQFAPEFTRHKPRRHEGPRSVTMERVRKMAGLERAKWTQEVMAPFVYWDTPGSCQQNIRPFRSKNKRAIEKEKSKLTEAEVQQIVLEASKFLQSLPKI